MGFIKLLLSVFFIFVISGCQDILVPPTSITNDKEGKSIIFPLSEIHADFPDEQKQLVLNEILKNSRFSNNNGCLYQFHKTPKGLVSFSYVDRYNHCFRVVNNTIVIHDNSRCAIEEGGVDREKDCKYVPYGTQGRYISEIKKLINGHLSQTLNEQIVQAKDNYLLEYREKFESADTSFDYREFIDNYHSYDPDGLIPKAEKLYKTVSAKEHTTDEKNRKLQEIAYKRRLKEERNTILYFQSVLKPGDDSHCGLVIEIKKPLVKIQTMIGEKWFKIHQIYPQNFQSCEFHNGTYSEKTHRAMM